jgi:hypothetical protein
MALTLASGISASDRYCTVNQPPTQPPGSYYRIGDEVIQHIGYVTTTPIWSPMFTQLYIARAQLGTTAASHLSGAALTYVRSEFLSAPAETDPGPFGTDGGGVVTVAVHEFELSVATTNFVDPADNGATTLTIPSGSLCHVFFIIKTTFNNSGNLVVYIATAVDDPNPAQSASYTVVGSGLGLGVEPQPWFSIPDVDDPPGRDHVSAAIGSLATSSPRWCTFTGARTVYAAFYSDNPSEPPTVGGGTIYALTATPVA